MNRPDSGGPMQDRPYTDLSRRERQIMDILYRLGSAAVAEVQAELPDPPSYSAVRAMLGKLEDKGHLKHTQDGARYVYHPSHPREEARQSAVRRLLRTFFDGSPTRAVAAVLDLSDEAMDEAELDRLAEMIDEARARGR